MLKIYNSLTGKKEPFKSIEEGKVRLYVCGMTVYDFCHLGHARTLIAFDVVVRYLKYLGYDVDYVRNITDIDDKIIKRANEKGEDYQVLTQQFIDALHEDCHVLELLPPTQEPRATDFMSQIIEMVKTLVDKGFAYVGENGDVYFDVRKIEDYGKLSKRHLDEMQSGARVEVSEAKRDPFDFVLWKMAKLGEPSWDSPWGEGRPGWHIECSAMSTHCLAPTIDIHGGGKDLIFPHHENEILQSEAANGVPFVNVWMHGGHLQVDKQKMSKSLGNFFTIRDILVKYAPEIVRYFVVTSHYRSPLNYSEDSLSNAKQALVRLYAALKDVEPKAGNINGDYEERFKQAMDDDFNTPEALAVLFDLARSLNKAKEEGDDSISALAALLKKLGGILGLLQQDPDIFFEVLKMQNLSENDATEIEALIKARNEARANKDWLEADRIRDQLQEQGVELLDSAEGTTWRRR